MFSGSISSYDSWLVALVSIRAPATSAASACRALGYCVALIAELLGAIVAIAHIPALGAVRLVDRCGCAESGCVLVGEAMYPS